MKKYIIPFFVAAIAMLVGCAEDDTKSFLSEVQVSSSYVALPAAGGSVSIDVNAKDAWTITNVPGWLIVSPMSGSAGASTVTFTAGAASETQTGTVTLECSGQTQNINVIQQTEKTDLPVTPISEIIANIGSTYRAKGTVTRVSSESYGNIYIEDETASIYIYGLFNAGGKYPKDADGGWASFGIEVGDIITVEGGTTLYGSTPEFKDATLIAVEKSLIKVDSLSIADGTLPVEGGEITVVLENKGADFSVEIPEAAKSWLSIVSLNAGAAPEVTFRASENTKADREATITFKTTYGGKDYTAVATIKQKGVAKGSGTDTDPYNVAAVIGYVQSLGADVESPEDVYVKGIISSVKYEYSAQHGTATYNISDDGEESGVFTVYSGLYFGGEAWQEGDDQIKVGDEVIVCGKVINYKGTTPEFVSKKSSLVSLNGKTSFVPVSIAEFNAAEVSATQYRITGVITKVANASYGNYYIRDWSGETYVYGTGAKGDFEALGLKEGDIVTVTGKRDVYKETIEMTGSKVDEIISVKEISIADFLNQADDKNVYYKVTGTIDEIASDTYGNLYITDGTNRLYVYGCYPGYGATGDNRKGWLAKAGIAVGNKLTMIGYKDTFKGTIELCGGIYFSHE